MLISPIDIFYCHISDKRRHRDDTETKQRRHTHQKHELLNNLFHTITQKRYMD